MQFNSPNLSPNMKTPVRAFQTTCRVIRPAALLLALALWMTISDAPAGTFAPASGEPDLAPQDSQKRRLFLNSLPLKTDQFGRAYYEIDDMIFLLDDSRDVDSAFTGNRWTGGILYYEFDSNVTTTNRQNWRDAAATWSAAAALTFIEGTGNGNYVHVQSGTGNNSAVGMRGGLQTMNIVSWNSRYIIAHEIGHALGLIHEHQRSDRDTYVTINSSNVQSGYEGNFPSVSSTNYGGYDFDSVMHYDKCSFSTDCPAGSTCQCTHYTISVNSPYTSEWQNQIGQRDHLSASDQSGMAQRYGGGGGQTVELLANGGFESGTTGWTINGNAYIAAMSYPHAGSYYAYLGTVDNGFGNLFNSVSVAIPASATSATLSFWLNITSEESGSTPFDIMNVSLLPASGGSVSVASYSNADEDANAGNPYYSQHSFDVSAYKGQSVKVYFDVTTDSSLITTFRIDDVSLTATVPGVKGDFNGDGRSDLIWQSANTGQVVLWFMDGQGNEQSGKSVQNGASFPGWNVMGAGDLNSDGKSDFMWQNSSNGQVYLWFMDGQGNQQGGRYIQNGATFPGWNVMPAGDLNGDGKSDIMWQNASNGQVYIWFMDGQGNQQGGRYIQNGATFPGWNVIAGGDLNSDGKSDLIWQNASSGQAYIWFMDGQGNQQGGRYVQGGTNFAEWKIKP